MVFSKFGRDVFVYGGIDLLFRSLQFLVLPIYAFQLSVAEFGLLALLQVTCGLLGMALNMGVNNAVQRFYFDQTTEQGQRAAVVSSGLAQLLFSTVLGIATIYATAYVVLSRLELPFELPWIYLSLALLTIVPEQVAQYSLDVSRLQFAPLRFFAIAVMKNVVGVLLGLTFLVLFDLGVRGILLGTLMAALLAAPIGLWMIRSDLTLCIDRTVALKIRRFGVPFVLVGAAYWIFGSIDRWMLAAMSDIEQVGLLSIGLKLAAIPTFAIAAFGQAWSPFAYKLAATQPGYQQLFAQILSSWFFVLALMALALSLFASEIMTLLFPETYLSASPIFSVAVCGIALYGTTLITALGVTITKRTMFLSHAAWIAAFVNIGANLLLIPLLGGLGAAIATLISYSVLTIALFYWSQKLHPLPIEWGKIGYSCTLLVAALVASALNGGEMGMFATIIKLFAIILALAGGFAIAIISPMVFHELKQRMP